MWNKQTFLKNKQKLYSAGGETKKDREHQKGKMTARERMETLFDEHKFSEIEAYAKSRFEIEDIKKEHFLGDGVIAGYGLVDGINVYAVAQDCTISGGAGGETHVNKICRTLELAIKTKSPFILLCDSGGARIEEGILSLAAYSRLFYLNQKASGIIPQIAAIMGNCAGGSSYSPAMCDFVFMVRETGQFFITGPKVIKALTGEEITMEQLGGADVHSRWSGQVHFVTQTDYDCIMQIRKLLLYLAVPQINYLDKKINFRELGKKIEILVPENVRHSYDVLNVIQNIVDMNSFMEVLPDFAPNMVIGFARLGGRSIGIVANQPNRMGGAIDCDAADKCARFVRTCDCFNIPILVLTDVPGFLPGSQEEKKGILRHGCKMLYSFSEATVPKVTVIMRKAYGGAYCAMNSKDTGADIVFAWPICEIAVMGADGAVDVIFSKQIKAANNPEKLRNEKIEIYENTYLTPYFAAACGMVDEIICPEETREKLIHAFKSLEDKTIEKVDRKHGNIVL